MYKETRWRSIVKTLSWRMWATFTTIILVYIFVGKPLIALSVGGLEVIAKMILYFVHERAWNKMQFGRREIRPAVLWFTGLSGSGKSTVAKRIFELLQKKGLKTEYLDGDRIRDIFPQTGFSQNERNIHIKRVGYLASKLEKNGIFVVASFISPYTESREFVKNLCSDFIEIYISTPVEECERRDVKGLYVRARKGDIQNFTGVNDPYEKPESPALCIDTTNISIEDATKQVMEYVRNRF